MLGMTMKHPLCLGFTLIARFLIQRGALTLKSEAEGPVPDGGEDAPAVSRL